MLELTSNVIQITLAIYGERAVNKIKDNIKSKPVQLRGKLKSYSQPVNASGKTAESIKFHLKDNLLVITGRKYSGTVEYGRKPGSISKEGQDNLKAWMQLRGIDPGAFWPIKKAIEKRGTLMHQQYPQGSNVLDVFRSGELDIENLKKELMTQMRPVIASQILKAWQ